MYGARFERKPLNATRGRLRSHGSSNPIHTSQSPGEIYRSRAGGPQARTSCGHRIQKPLRRARGLSCREDYAVRCRNAYRGSAADHELLYGLGDLHRCGHQFIALRRRKRALIQDRHLTVVGH